MNDPIIIDEMAGIDIDEMIYHPLRDSISIRKDELAINEAIKKINIKCSMGVRAKVKLYEDRYEGEQINLGIQ